MIITLTIIGIIAALTIPTLMQKYKKHVWAVSAHNTYSMLNNQFREILAKNSCSDFECMSARPKADGYGGVNQFMDDLILNYFPNAVKIKSNELKSIKVKLIDGSETTLDKMTFSDIFIYYRLNNGRIFGCWDLSFNQRFNCSYGRTTCGECIFTTEPGTKNLIYGRNIFNVKLLGDGSLIPHAEYQDDSKRVCSPPQSYNAIIEDGCLPRLMQNGWVMDY